MAAALRAVGFDDVTMAVDVSRDKMIEALRTFAAAADKADWAVVYYAGHGIEVNGVNYLIPVDAKLASDRDVLFEAMPLDQVMAAIDGAKKLKLVVLDACRDNPFANAARRRRRSPAAIGTRRTRRTRARTRCTRSRLGEVKVQGASLVVYAAKHGQTALDGEGENSPFAVAVVQRIATPGVEINKLFRLVRDDVMEATAGRQEPYTYGSLPGREDFFVNGDPAGRRAKGRHAAAGSGNGPPAIAMTKRGSKSTMPPFSPFSVSVIMSVPNSGLKAGSDCAARCEILTWISSPTGGGNSR